MAGTTMLARSMAVLLAIVAAGIFGGCSKSESAQSNPTQVESPAPKPRMTDAEIAEVVESAKAAVRLIEDSNARLKALGKVPLATIVETRRESDPKTVQAFDRAGAERFLAEHPEHAEASFVREVMNRVAGMELSLREVTANVEFSTRYDSLTQGSPTWFIELDAALDTKIKELRAVKRDATALLPQVVSAANRSRLNNLLTRINESIAIDEELRKDAVPHVARQKFIANGGIEVTAKQLYKDFDANEIAALQKYGDREVRVTGKVARIVADFMDKPAVHLATGNRYQTVTVSGVPANVAAGLKKGQDFVVYCVSISEVVGSPMCQSAPWQ